jgi:uncharacterized protein with NRDE domain
MCLILFSLHDHPRYPLIIAANRDESYRRPTTALGFWPDAPDIAAGRDQQAGGTWLGITRQGRWAALTNFRQAGSYRQGTPSRGQLVADFLRGDSSPQAYMEQIEPNAHAFNGFNLLVGDPGSVYYLSNREDRGRRVAGGIHGLSNHLLDTPWPKVELGKQTLHSLPDAPAEAVTEILLGCLRHCGAVPDTALPDTGVGRARERMLSPPFIVSDVYGTRASTVILLDRDGRVTIEEHAFGPLGVPQDVTRLEFLLAGGPATTVPDKPG